jgi:hypothetical protein
VDGPYEDWIQQDQTRALSSHTLYYTIQENTSYDSRVAYITFVSGDIEETVTITQAQTNAVILVDKVKNIESTSGTFSVTAKSNVDYQIEIPSDISWISISPETRSLKSSTTYFVADENSEYSPRTANILFKYDDLADTLTVTQEGFASLITVKTLGTFKQLYEGYSSPTRVKIVGPVYESELNSNLANTHNYWNGKKLTVDGCTYCDLSEAIIYDDNNNIEEKLGAFIIPYKESFRGGYFDFDRISCLIFPNYITEIGDFVDHYCLQRISFTNNVTSLGDFSESSLCTITIPESVINPGKFEKCQILYKASLYCSEVPSFSDCVELKDVYLSDNVKVIGEKVFYGCNSLENITIPNSVTEIKESAFSHCKKLEGIAIPNSVTELGGYAFEYCSNLGSVVLSESLKSINPYTFCHANLSSISIPDNITKIGEYAFEYNEKMEKVSLPSHLVEIGENAFHGCSKLSNVSFPNNLQKIDPYAFADCPIENVSIPCDVTYIGSHAFNKVGTCYIYAKVPPTHGNESFIAKNFGESTLYVPKGCLEAYKDWNTMFYNIYEMEE